MRPLPVEAPPRLGAGGPHSHPPRPHATPGSNPTTETLHFGNARLGISEATASLSSSALSRCHSEPSGVGRRRRGGRRISRVPRQATDSFTLCQFARGVSPGVRRGGGARPASCCHSEPSGVGRWRRGGRRISAVLCQATYSFTRCQFARSVSLRGAHGGGRVGRSDLPAPALRPLRFLRTNGAAAPKSNGRIGRLRRTPEILRAPHRLPSTPLPSE